MNSGWQRGRFKIEVLAKFTCCQKPIAKLLNINVGIKKNFVNRNGGAPENLM
jgi:hypothetical protein